MILDDYYRYTWAIFLKSKDETFREFEALMKKTQRRLGHQLVLIRFDHGIEFKNSDFMEYCDSNGISHNFSAPRTPQQNGLYIGQALHKCLLTC